MREREKKKREREREVKLKLFLHVIRFIWIVKVDFVADNYHDQLARVLQLIYEILITQCLYMCVYLEAQFNEN